MALTDKLTAIADVIRSKTGNTDKISLDNMPMEIENAYNICQEVGYSEGYNTAYDFAYDAGYELGFEAGVVEGGGSGGLPSGVTALNSGTFTFTTDQTSKPAISHGLGTMPNFFIVFAEGGPFALADFQKYIVSQFGITQYYTESSTTVQKNYTIYRYGMSSKFSENHINSSVFTSFADGSVFYPYSGTSAMLKAGVTYRWIAGVAEGM